MQASFILFAAKPRTFVRSVFLQMLSGKSSQLQMFHTKSF